MRLRFLLVAMGVLTCALFAGGRSPARAMTVPRIFSDHMVLQRGAKTPFWGTGIPGERVTVSLANRTVTAIVDQHGRWRAHLRDLPVGGPFELAFSGNTLAKFSDVLVGDVWLAAGQSNMNYMMCQDWTNEQATVNLPEDPLLRLYSRRIDIPTVAPQDDPKALWASTAPDWFAPPCNPWIGFKQGRFRTWPAVPYYFAREIRARTGVPVGIINLTAGGTDIENWISKDTLRKQLPDVLDYITRKASPEYGMRPSLRWDAVVAPVAGFVIRGVLWYQGESNSWGRFPFQYERTLTVLIKDWRERWKQDFPFIIVQVANYVGKPEIYFQLVREAQLHVATSVRNTALVVTIDTGNGDLHPPNKLDIGHRLALAARAISYHEHVPYCGPTLKGYTIAGNQIIVRFAHAQGLYARDGPLKYIVIAGADRKFVAAAAQIVGEKLIVSSPEVATPVAVRYAWMNNPIGANLYNNADLPASPFRTDNWP